MTKLIITKQQEGYLVTLVYDSDKHKWGGSVAEAVGLWVLAYGHSHDIELVYPGSDPFTPDASKGVLDEDELLAFANSRTGRPMSPHEREWCLQEITGVEGYERKDYETSDNKQLARAVLNAWVDYCRDKGTL